MKQVKLAIYKRITMPWILSNTTMQTPTRFFSPVLSRIRPVGRFYNVLIELHETVNIPGLLANAESWSLNRSEKTELERTEIQALKFLFDLPAHTPTPAIIFSVGTLFTTQ